MNQVGRRAQKKRVGGISRGTRHDVLRAVVKNAGIGAVVGGDGIFVKAAALRVTKRQVTGAIAIKIGCPAIGQSGEGIGAVVATNAVPQKCFADIVIKRGVVWPG